MSEPPALPLTSCALGLFHLLESVSCLRWGEQLTGLARGMSELVLGKRSTAHASQGRLRHIFNAPFSGRQCLPPHLKQGALLLCTLLFPSQHFQCFIRMPLFFLLVCSCYWAEVSMRARTLCFIPYSLCKARPRTWQVTCSQETFTKVLDDKQWLQVQCSGIWLLWQWHVWGLFLVHLTTSSLVLPSAVVQICLMQATDKGKCDASLSV